MANLMEGGFGQSIDHPQFDHGGVPLIQPDIEEKSRVVAPTEPTWYYTYTPASFPAEADLFYDNGYGVSFNDTYNGVFDVDVTVDTEAEYDAVITPEE